MSGCAVCGRDLGRYGYTTGNTLDGYTVRGNMCQDCNRSYLREQGLHAEADRDERNERLATGFWRVVGWGFVALLAIIAIGAIFG